MADPQPKNNSLMPRGLPQPGNLAGQTQEITPEMLEKVIERVYQLLLKDLLIENERSGCLGRVRGERSGGWQ